VNRTERAFERRFRELLAQLGARDREKGVRWLFRHAAELKAASGQTLSHALAELNIRLAGQVHRFQARVSPPHSTGEPCSVFCDAGLGGLARWLRASGCDARWVQDISDSDLVRRAEEAGATIITTDSFLLDRRPIAQGRVRAIWVPPSLTRHEQLRLVRAELNLGAADSRCMRCGGELAPVKKENVKNRIPPKTYHWVNDYFQCARCGQLFWHGTHWQKILARLAEKPLNNRPSADP
jgi:uncharacterized protein with PIN domain